MHSKIHLINHYSIMPKGATSILIKISLDQVLSKYQHAPNLRSKLRHYLKFSHGILLLRITSNPITCNHLLNHILESMTHNPLDMRHDLYS